MNTEGEEYDLDARLVELSRSFKELQLAARDFSEVFNMRLDEIKGVANALLILPEDVSIKRGNLQINTIDLRCTWCEVQIPLSLTEIKIVATMAKRPEMVYSRDFFLDAFCPDADGDRLIDSHIKRIRNKFRKIDPGFNQIATIYGAGYRWNA